MKRAHCPLLELGSQLRQLPGRTLYPGRILVVDDEAGHYGNSLAALLPECQFVFEPDPETARRVLLSSPVDLIILNHSPGIPCLTLLSDFKLLRPSVSIIVITGCGSEELAVQVFRSGAVDYFRKPVNVNELELTVRAALEFQRARKEMSNPHQVNGIQRALLFIEAKCSGPLSLVQVARKANMSISCFGRRLKKQTGMTFTGYVNAQRVARAKELIKKEEFSMLHIALACGFGTQSHFNRVFRKIAGITPGEYRKTDSSQC